MVATVWGICALQVCQQDVGLLYLLRNGGSCVLQIVVVLLMATVAVVSKGAVLYGKHQSGSVPEEEL